MKEAGKIVDRATAARNVGAFAAALIGSSRTYDKQVRSAVASDIEAAALAAIRTNGAKMRKGAPIAFAPKKSGMTNRRCDKQAANGAEKAKVSDRHDKKLIRREIVEMKKRHAGAKGSVVYRAVLDLIKRGKVEGLRNDYPNLTARNLRYMDTKA